MHEFDMARRVVAAVVDVAKREGFDKIYRMKIKLGRMSAVSGDHLRLLIKSENPTFSDTDVFIEEVDVRVKCKCGYEWIDRRFENQGFAHMYAHAPLLYLPGPCPTCGGSDCELKSGQELELVEIDGD